MARPHSNFPTVAPATIGGVAVGKHTVTIGGVAVSKHTLTAQAEQLASLTGRIGRRLNHWLRTHPDVLPSAEFFEAFRYHQAALLGLLREQRERARLAGGEPMSDEDYERAVQELRTEILRSAHTFTPDEWAMLDRVRAEQSQDQQRGPARGDPGTSDTDE